MVLSQLMVGTVKLEELVFLKERQSVLHCPGVLFNHCLSVYFHCYQQHRSQERPTNILATLL